MTGAASYLVQWRRSNQTFSSDRQKAVDGGSASRSAAIGGLKSGVYIVQVTALDDQGDEGVSEPRSIRLLSMWDEIMRDFINPRKEEYPWLAEAWFDAPLTVRVIPGNGVGHYGFQQKELVCIGRANCRDQSFLYQKLAQHYLQNAATHSGDPAAKLSMLSMWLHGTVARDQGHGGHVLTSISNSMSSRVINGGGATCVTPALCTTVASASQHQIPKWFYNNYTSDGTLDTVDLDKVWSGLRKMAPNPRHVWAGQMVGHTRTIFGGHCSYSEAVRAQWDTALGNPWLEGGCVNRRPQALAADAGGAGELVVSWQAPLWSTTPEIDAYVVQWKSGDQDYDSTRQAVVTDLDSLSHTITGLTADTEYSVRVAAVNQTDTADHADDDGRERTAETTGSPGSGDTGG